MRDWAYRRLWQPYRHCYNSSETVKVAELPTIPSLVLQYMCALIQMHTNSVPLCFFRSWHHIRTTCRVKVCHRNTDKGQDLHSVCIFRLRAVPQVHYYDIAGGGNGEGTDKQGEACVCVCVGGEGGGKVGYVGKNRWRRGKEKMGWSV